MNVIRVTGRAFGLLILAVTLACSKKPASLEVSPKRILLYGIDRAQRLTARVLDKRGEALDTVRPTWASSKKEVADVDEGGRVVARGEGKATVTVTAGELTAEVPVEVIDAASIESMTFPTELSTESMREIREFVRTKSAVLVGPGLPDSDNAYQLIRELVSSIDRPLVLDQEDGSPAHAHDERS